MYKVKYSALIADEEIQIDELPTSIIRQIKAIKPLINLAKNLPETDSKYLTLMEKDQKICDMINHWLDDVMEEESAETSEPSEMSEPATEQNNGADNADVNTETPVAATATPESPDYSQFISQINENKTGNRIHERDLTTILGRKPDKDFSLNNMRLRRVFLGDGWYQIS